MENTNATIRPIEEKNKEWIKNFLAEQWGSVDIITRGKSHNAADIPGYIAFKGNKPIGLITYVIENNECEIVSLNSLLEGKGIGSQLIEVVKKTAEKNKCKRLWLIETNDNTKALHFYQKRGFHLIAVHPDALEESRKMKPEIPLIGNDGIPLRDELELEVLL